MGRGRDKGRRWEEGEMDGSDNKMRGRIFQLGFLNLEFPFKNVFDF